MKIDTEVDMKGNNIINCPSIDNKAIDIDNTNIGDGKTLVYDATTKKHKYVNNIGTDELVKMDNTTDAKHLIDLIDKNTIVNDNGTLKVKKLDGQDVSITEINYLKGLTMNVMNLVNMFANGGVKIINTPVNTYADLLAYDKSSLINDISYIIYVLADETHSGAKTTYLIDKTTITPTFFGNADEHRDFVTNPISLANEVTGKLGTSHIDIDSLWSLLTINDTYKTLTTKDEVFGTHGAKALYDELVADIGNKANTSAIRMDESVNPENYEVGAWFAEGHDSILLSTSDGHPCSEWHIGYVVTGYEVSDSEGYKIILAIAMSGNCYIKVQQWNTWSKWRKICTTSVADVAKTNITSRVVNATVSSNSGVSYSVKNGRCYVQFADVTTTTTSSGGYLLSTGTLPPIDISLSNGHYPVASASSVNGLVVVEANTGGVRYYGGVMTIFTTISYPVAES